MDDNTLKAILAIVGLTTPISLALAAAAAKHYATRLHEVKHALDKVEPILQTAHHARFEAELQVADLVGEEKGRRKERALRAAGDAAILNAVATGGITHTPNLPAKEE
jgi:hypothetical protein